MATQRNGTSARDRLLDSAETLFFTDGIANTGVDDVLEHSGISVATLYSHFGSKDGLLKAALERRLGIWRSIWDEAIDAASTDESRLLAIFDALELYRQRHQAAKWCAFLSTTTELPGLGSAVQTPVGDDTALLVERLQELAAPLVLGRAAELAADILLIYNGALTAFLRGQPHDPIGRARRIGSAVIGAQTDRVGA